MAKGGHVIWPEIRSLAGKIDRLYDSKLSSGRPNDGKCVATKTQSSEQEGIPELCKDVTTPFPIEFPVQATLYQRFEFAYYETVGMQTMYNSYKNGTNKPIYHSCYLVKSASAKGSSMVGPGELGIHSSVNTVTNVCHLIENKREKFHKWWPDCSKYTGGIAAELYFLTGKQSKCPCPCVYRVAYAVGVNGNNGNGNEDGRLYSKGGTIHSWSLKSATTLAEPSFSKLGPEDTGGGAGARGIRSFSSGGGSGGGGNTYPPPPVGCCAEPVFPTLGAEGGGNTIMYDINMFNSGFWGAQTKPFTKLVEDMTWAEYQVRLQEGSLPPFAPAESTGVYDKYSKHEQWSICSDGEVADVRITSLMFKWRYSMQDKVMVSIVWVPTAITRTLVGAFQPAIRKRWYDMMYYKLRHIIGYKRQGDAYPHGTTWNAKGEKELSAYDKPCSRWLAKGFGWEKHKEAKDTPGSFFGEKYFEQFVCIKNYRNGISCDGEGQGEYNAAKGCYCSEIKDKPETCSDLTCQPSIKVPWEGGCANESCDSGKKTHWETVEYLEKIATYANNNKEPEPINSLMITGAWAGCAVEYKKGQQYTLNYTYPVGGSDLDTYTYHYETFMSSGTLEYFEMKYEDQGCGGCGEGADCPITVGGGSGDAGGGSGSGGGGSGGGGASDTGTKLTIKPKEGVPVCAGMVWATFLHGSPPTKKTIKISGSIAKLLVPGNKYKIVGNKDKPCVDKDAKPEPEHPELLPACDGGIITVVANFGPVGTKMKKASKSINFRRGNESITEIDESLELEFNESSEGGGGSSGSSGGSGGGGAGGGTQYQYRFSVVLYIEVWCAGPGENNPYTLLIPDCFKPESTTLNVGIS